MMSLVAYGSSGESDNESDQEGEQVAEPSARLPLPAPVNGKPSSPVKDIQPNVSKPIHVTQDHQAVASSSKASLQSKLPAPKTIIEEKKNEVDNDDQNLALGAKLPAPKHHTTSSLLEGSVIMPKDPKVKGKRMPVKIAIPSLADFPDDEDEPKARKKIQPSAKGSGLFALLPPPKQASLGAKNLVPKSVTRKPIPTPPVKKPPPRPAVQPVKRKHPESDPESDGENDGGDFFSLNKEEVLPEIPQAELIALTNPSTYSKEEPVRSFEEPSSSHQQNMAYGEYANYQQYSQQVAESMESNAIPQANSGQNFIGFSQSEDLQLDEEALQKLCGRRRREEIQIVDVSGDSIMPDQREWLTKQLTEEQPRPSSKSKLHGISSQQKRKHQITYLAHIAKENELELKNQWANNRQTRKQTQSKYGF